MKGSTLITALAAINLLMVSCSKDYSNEDNNNPAPEAIIVKDDGNNLDASLAQLRSILGDTLNNAPNKTSGRREVNWDGVSPAFSNNNAFPADFFNNTDPGGPNGRKRGVVYKTGTQVRVDSSAFQEIDPSYATTFRAFSPKKLIAPVGSNITELSFKVPGTNVSAFIKGFGLIFSDVDITGYTSVEYFQDNKSLGVFKVPASNHPDGFSLLGVYFPDNQITKVRIITGNGILQAGVKDISEGGTKDLVVMDDFFYNEPLPGN